MQYNTIQKFADAQCVTSISEALHELFVLQSPFETYRSSSTTHSFSNSLVIVCWDYRIQVNMVIISVGFHVLEVSGIVKYQLHSFALHSWQCTKAINLVNSLV